MNENKTEDESNNALFKLYQGLVFQIAKRRLSIKCLEKLLEEKGIIKPEEMQKMWDSMVKSDLKKVFEEIGAEIGQENVKLSLGSDGSINISGRVDIK